MNKETLRMQLLAGLITESQYKHKLEENKSITLGGNEIPSSEPITLDKETGIIQFTNRFFMFIGSKRAYTDIIQAIHPETDKYDLLVDIEDTVFMDDFTEEEKESIINYDFSDEELLKPLKRYKEQYLYKLKNKATII